MDERWRKSQDELQQRMQMRVACEIASALLDGDDKEKDEAKKQLEGLKQKSGEPYGGWAGQIISKVTAIVDSVKK